MGCCNSTENASHDDSPSPPLPAAERERGRGGGVLANPGAAAGATNTGNRSSPRRGASNNAHQTASTSNNSKPAAPTRPNRPIRAPSPLPSSPTHLSPQSSSAAWTRAQLDRERDAFFDTRVSGNREVWGGLRVVSEMLRQVPPSASTTTTALAGERFEGRGIAQGDGSAGGEGQEEGRDEEVEEEGNVEGLQAAQAVLDALNLSCPQGRVACGRGRDRAKGGLYDERGTLYELPLWVLRDPDDLVEDGKEEKEGLVLPDNADYDDDDDEEIAAAKRRQEKGKGRAADVGEIVRLKARLSDRGSDVYVSIGTKQKLGLVVQGIREQVGAAKRIRLVYLGKMLDEAKTLEECEWRDGHVVNAFVFEEDLTPVVESKKRKKKLGR